MIELSRAFSLEPPLHTSVKNGAFWSIFDLVIAGK